MKIIKEISSYILVAVISFLISSCDGGSGDEIENTGNKDDEYEIETGNEHLYGIDNKEDESEHGDKNDNKAAPENTMHASKETPPLARKSADNLEPKPSGVHSKTLPSQTKAEILPSSILLPKVRELVKMRIDEDEDDDEDDDDDLVRKLEQLRGDSRSQPKQNTTKSLQEHEDFLQRSIIGNFAEIKKEYLAYINFIINSKSVFLQSNRKSKKTEIQQDLDSKARWTMLLGLFIPSNKNQHSYYSKALLAIQTLALHAHTEIEKEKIKPYISSLKDIIYKLILRDNEPLQAYFKGFDDLNKSMDKELEAIKKKYQKAGDNYLEGDVLLDTTNRKIIKIKEDRTCDIIKDYLNKIESNPPINAAILESLKQLVIEFNISMHDAFIQNELGLIELVKGRDCSMEDFDSFLKKTIIMYNGKQTNVFDHAYDLTNEYKTENYQ